MIYVCILLFIILITSYISSNQIIFAPSVIVSGIWFICILLYFVLDHGLYPINNKFLVPISIWVSCFCFFSLLAQSLSVSTPFKNISPNKVARDIYFYFSLITLPFLVYDIYTLITKGLGSNIFSVLRNANIIGFEKQGIERTSSFFVIFWFVSYIIELLSASKSNRFRLATLLLMNIFYAFITMGKSSFLSIFIASAIILFYQKKIKLKTIALGVGILFFLFLGIQTIRSNNNDQIHSNDFISLYLLAGMPAFETLEPASTTYFGENTFRFIYAVGYKFHLIAIEPKSALQEFVSVPESTNVYTVLYPYYKDFGLIGIIIFASLLGFLFGHIFKRAQRGDTYSLVIYSLLSICLVLQFMNDVFFMTFSQNLQYIIIAYIPFFITKNKLFLKH